MISKAFEALHFSKIEILLRLRYCALLGSKSYLNFYSTTLYFPNKKKSIFSTILQLKNKPFVMIFLTFSLIFNESDSLHKNGTYIVVWSIRRGAQIQNFIKILKDEGERAQNDKFFFTFHI